MAETRTAREIAETIIRSHTEDIEWGAINDMTEDEFDALGEEAHEALCREVDDLISNAVITVTWPDADHHIVDLRANGWTVQHPDGCRPNLFDCPVNLAAERDLVNQPVRLGRFACALDDDGRFELGAAVIR